jgi:hypothetical protein
MHTFSARIMSAGRYKVELGVHLLQAGLGDLIALVHREPGKLPECIANNWQISLLIAPTNYGSVTNLTHSLRGSWSNEHHATKLTCPLFFDHSQVESLFG